ncbi:hypothetical protein Tco_0832642 [Tanacetum coccineum]|uniref:Uncharacterized protein n=1 Tax=Tanacetum coccineum TaxID=301880 RepID=A0ABQ4YP09_9ASTR
MGEFGLSVHRSGGSICSGVVRRGVAQSGQRICFGRFEALPEGKREWPFLLPSVETEIEDWAFSLFYREAAGVNSVSSSSPCFLPASACALPQKEAHIVTIHRDSCLWLYSNWQRDNGLIPTPMGSVKGKLMNGSEITRYSVSSFRPGWFLLGINRFTLSGLGPRLDKAVAPPSTRRESRRSTCPRVEEFDDWPSLQKIPELVDSESAGLEESGATRIFNGFESLLIPGGRPNSMEFAISQACRLSKERPVIKRAPFSVDEIRMKGIISTMLFSGLLFKISFWPAVLGGYYSFLSIEPLSLIPLVQPSSRTCTIDATEIANSIIEKIRKGATIWHQISGGVERAAVRSGKTIKKRRLFVEVSTERPLGSGKRITITANLLMLHPSSMESAKHWELPGEELGTGTRRSENHLNGGIDCISSFVPHSNWGSKSTKFDDLLRERRSKSMLLKTLQDMSGRPPLIVYEQNTSPKASKGVIQMDQEKIRSVLDWEVPKKERAGSSGEAGCSKQFAFFYDKTAQEESKDGFKENVETPSVWSARPAELAAEEIRRTNAAGGVQNRPAEDGRVHVVEPRAREALKKGGGDGRLYSESMPELDSAKMIIDAGSSDNIASTEMQTRLLPSELAKEKGVGIAFLDVGEESIECYALIAKPTSRVEDRWDAVALRDKG